MNFYMLFLSILFSISNAPIAICDDKILKFIVPKLWNPQICTTQVQWSSQLRFNKAFSANLL